MHYSNILAFAIAVAGVSATPVEKLEQRAKKSPTIGTTMTTLTTTSFMPAYPYTASMCAVTPVPSPSSVFHCNSIGYLTKPSVLVDGLFTGSFSGCADICQQAQPCISFGFNADSKLCTLYNLPLTDMGLVDDQTATVEFSNRHCFTCGGTTTVVFTAVSTTTITTTAVTTIPVTTKKGTTTKVTTTKVTTTKGKPSKTKATPTVTYTAGPINLVDGGDFSGKDLGGFQVSLSGATGSFSQVGKNYAYCCTAQLLAVDAVCMLSQNLDTDVGSQYDVGFYYKFVNKVAGLSSIIAPFSAGVIQQVLGGSSDYQKYASKYFSLTDPSLFTIVLNVPLGGNAVCITNITVTSF